jgi:hypothetical protein
VSLHPTNELVAVGWLRGITELGDLVATDLPQDNTTWSASGFVQVTAIGGSPEATLPIAKPVFSLDFWACNPDSGKLPWWKANQLAEHVRAAVHDHEDTPRLVALTGAYNDARVLTGYLVTEPRRIRDDAADFAHFSADLALAWVEIPP